MPYLDTDVMVDVLRNYQPAVKWLKSLGADPVLLSGFVIMELYQGCQNRVEHDKVEKVLAGCKVVWPSEDVCNRALSDFVEHHLSSGIGMLDVLIGWTAVSLGVTLHTFNEKHYRVIPGITVKEPYPRT